MILFRNYSTFHSLFFRIINKEINIFPFNYSYFIFFGLLLKKSLKSDRPYSEKMTNTQDAIPSVINHGNSTVSSTSSSYLNESQISQGDEGKLNRFLNNI